MAARVHGSHNCYAQMPLQPPYVKAFYMHMDACIVLASTLWLYRGFFEWVLQNVYEQTVYNMAAMLASNYNCTPLFITITFTLHYQATCGTGQVSGRNQLAHWFPSAVATAEQDQTCRLSALYTSVKEERNWGSSTLSRPSAHQTPIVMASSHLSHALIQTSNGSLWCPSKHKTATSATVMPAETMGARGVRLQAWDAAECICMKCSEWLRAMRLWGSRCKLAQQADACSTCGLETGRCIGIWLKKMYILYIYIILYILKYIIYI